MLVRRGARLFGFREIFLSISEQRKAIMKPTIGRIVIYRFAEHERATFNNSAETAPAVITRVWSDTCVNLKVLADGPYDLWKTSVMQGDGAHNWNWLVRDADQIFHPDPTVWLPATPVPNTVPADPGFWRGPGDDLNAPMITC